MLKNIAWTVLLALVSITTRAQDSGEEAIEYAKEITYGINFNTNAGRIGGVAVKYSRALSSDWYHTFGLEIVNVKHPQEVNFISRVGGRFIPGKVDYLFAVRPQYGRELVLFRKAPEDGVHLNAVLAGGPSIGLLKPYYVLFNTDDNRTISIPNSPVLNALDIQNHSAFSEGLDEIEARLGAHIKAGLNFEFGRFNNSVVGIETGFLAEAYTREIAILPTAERRSLFTSAFLTLYYGSKY